MSHSAQRAVATTKSRQADLHGERDSADETAQATVAGRRKTQKRRLNARQHTQVRRAEAAPAPSDVREHLRFARKATAPAYQAARGTTDLSGMEGVTSARPSTRELPRRSDTRSAAEGTSRAEGERGATHGPLWFPHRSRASSGPKAGAAASTASSDERAAARSIVDERERGQLPPSGKETAAPQRAAERNVKQETARAGSGPSPE